MSKWESRIRILYARVNPSMADEKVDQLIQKHGDHLKDLFQQVCEKYEVSYPRMIADCNDAISELENLNPATAKFFYMNRGFCRKKAEKLAKDWVASEQERIKRGEPREQVKDSEKYVNIAEKNKGKAWYYLDQGYSQEDAENLAQEWLASSSNYWYVTKQNIEKSWGEHDDDFDGAVRWYLRRGYDQIKAETAAKEWIESDDPAAVYKRSVLAQDKKGKRKRKRENQTPNPKANDVDAAIASSKKKKRRKATNPELPKHVTLQLPPLPPTDENGVIVPLELPPMVMPPIPRGFDPGHGTLQTPTVEQSVAEHESMHEHRMKIPGCSVGLVIGKDGSNMLHLTQDIGVRIHIDRPKDKREDHFFVIHGTRVQIDKARALLQNIIENDPRGEYQLKKREMTVHMKVPARSVSLIIGMKGVTLDRMMEETGARIDIDRPVDKTQDHVCIISGVQSQIEHATKMIQDIVDKDPRNVNQDKPLVEPVKNGFPILTAFVEDQRRRQTLALQFQEELLAEKQPKMATDQPQVVSKQNIQQQQNVNSSDVAPPQAALSGNVTALLDTKHLDDHEIQQIASTNKNFKKLIKTIFKPQMHRCIQILVPQVLVGTVVGRKGNRINQMKIDSGAYIGFEKTMVKGDQHPLIIIGTQTEVDTAERLAREYIDAAQRLAREQLRCKSDEEFLLEKEAAAKQKAELKMAKAATAEDVAKAAAEQDAELKMLIAKVGHKRIAAPSTIAVNPTLDQVQCDDKAKGKLTVEVDLMAYQQPIDMNSWPIPDNGEIPCFFGKTRDTKCMYAPWRLRL